MNSDPNFLLKLFFTRWVVILLAAGISIAAVKLFRPKSESETMYSKGIIAWWWVYAGIIFLMHLHRFTSLKSFGDVTILIPLGASVWVALGAMMIQKLFTRFYDWKSVAMFSFIANALFLLAINLWGEPQLIEMINSMAKK